MRKFLAICAVFSIGSAAHAQAEQANAFDCMDKQTFEVNSVCMASKISQTVGYKRFELDIAEKASNQSDSVMATMKFYPKDMLIEVVSHRDALSDKSLQASLSQ